MPNWCKNSATIRHPDAEQITRIVEALKREELLGEFFPCPKELCETMAGGHADHEEQNLLRIQERANRMKHGYDNWYDWCVGEWGTKWDVGAVEQAIKREEPNTVSFGFDSAWAPPVKWYMKMLDLGFEITAYYVETGVGYCGMFVDGEATDFDIQDADVPEVIKEEFPYVFESDEWDESEEK